MTIVVDKGLKQTNDNRFGDWNRLFNNEINDDIIIVGNSRAKVHFNPIIIEEITGYCCYNLGKDATNLFLQQPVINSVLMNAKPKYLVLSLDIGSFQKKQEIFEKEQYLPFLDKPYINPVLSEVDKNVSIEGTFPIVKYRGQFNVISKGLKSFLSPVNSYTMQKGFDGREREWNNDFNNFKRIMGDDKVLLSKNEIENGLTLLKEIILKCKRNNVEVILCQTPKYKELNKYFPQKEEVDIKITRLAKEYNVLYFDLSDEWNENKDMFYNASHLNVKGANKLSQKFSILFNEKIKSEIAAF